MYVNPARLHDIEAALLFLGLPPLSRPDSEDQAEYHQAADSPVRHFPQISSEHSELVTSSLRLSMSDLTASFSQLSTSTSSVQIPTALFPVRRTPAIRLDPSPRKNLKKYYVVTVGKCTGVFWDEWDDIIPFISGVSGAWYKGFATHELAAKFYLDAKKNGLVSVVRDPGDNKLFGPLCDAMQ